MQFLSYVVAAGDWPHPRVDRYTYKIFSGMHKVRAKNIIEKMYGKNRFTIELVHRIELS